MSVGTTGAIIIGGTAIAAGVAAGAMGSSSESDYSQWNDVGDNTSLGEWLGGRETMVKKVNPKYAGNQKLYEDLSKLGLGELPEDYWIQEKVTSKGGIQGAMEQYAKMVAKGPGDSDVEAATGAARDFASMLDNYAKNGAVPTDADITRGNDLSKALFAARQEGLNQSFTTQTTEANRLAARLGRSVDDPVLQAKLRTGMMNQQALLDAEKGAWASEYSMNQPMQRLQFAEGRVNLLDSLASKAFTNRATMLSMGSQLLNAERQWRLQTGVQRSVGESTSGGGLQGALAGFAGGAGTAMSMGGMMMPAGGGGLSRMFAPAATMMPATGGPMAPTYSNLA